MEEKTIREKLVKLGVLEKNLNDYVDIFSSCQTPEAVRRLIGSKHWGAGYEQALLPHFRKLFQEDENVRNATLNELRSCGVSDKIIEEYITKMGNCPFLILRTRYENIPAGLKEKLIENFEILMLKTLRQYLGYKK